MQAAWESTFMTSRLTETHTHKQTRDTTVHLSEWLKLSQHCYIRRMQINLNSHCFGKCSHFDKLSGHIYHCGENSSLHVFMTTLIWKEPKYSLTEEWLNHRISIQWITTQQYGRELQTGKPSKPDTKLNNWLPHLTLDSQNLSMATS
jgi:hypothetical protein